MIYSSRTFILFLVWVLPMTNNVKAQSEEVEEIPIENVRGHSIGSEAESLSIIRERAINEAKVEALNRAGISENIKAYSDFYESQTDGNYKDLFTSDIFSDMQGVVRDVKVVDQSRRFTENGLPEVTVEINCTVLKYHTGRDRTFEFEVEGIRPVYEQEDLLEYDIKPHDKGFLKVFIFTPEEAFQVYPNEYEEAFLLNPDEKESYDFPRKVDVVLETEKELENHRAVFVFLKENIPYTGKVTYEDIFDWIFSIPMHQRNVKTFSFGVTGS